MSTLGSTGSTTKSDPVIVTRPPSTAHNGWTAEIRDELEAVMGRFTAIACGEWDERKADTARVLPIAGAQL